MKEHDFFSNVQMQVLFKHPFNITRDSRWIKYSQTLITESDLDIESYNDGSAYQSLLIRLYHIILCQELKLNNIKAKFTNVNILLWWVLTYTQMT